MASNAEDVRRAALAELARRELARREQGRQSPQQSPQQPPSRSFGQSLGRSAAMNLADLYRGASSLVTMPLDALTAAHNLGVRTFYPEGHTVTVNGKKEHRSGLLPSASETRERDLAAFGVPQPENRLEETIGAGVRGAGATLATMGMGPSLATASSPVTRGVGSSLMANPGTQLAAGGAAGMSSDLARQAGFGPAVQIGAGLAGGVAAGGLIAGMSRTPQPPQFPSRAVSPAAQRLANAGVPLDRSQASGGRFMQMLRSAVTNHPATAGRQQAFGQQQQRAFTRAVLRSIGANSDEATQDVMSAAKSRIGSVFDEVGGQGAVFDDELQNAVAGIVDDAQRTTVPSDLAPLQRNVDDLLAAVGESGVINGEKFNRIRSLLSKLSRNPGVGQSARELEESMLEALERSHPGQRAVLKDAVDQWRSLRIIETAIDKGADRYISPLRLSNALATQRNRAMSVYGQGGDQGLVSLAQAGRSVLPNALPDSGTVPRGMMQMPLRAIATAPLYLGAQRMLNRPPLQSGPPLLGPAAAGAMVGSGVLSPEEQRRRRLVQALQAGPEELVLP